MNKSLIYIILFSLALSVSSVYAQETEEEGEERRSRWMRAMCYTSCSSTPLPTWSDTQVTPGQMVRSRHVWEIRHSIAEKRRACGMNSFINPTDYVVDGNSNREWTFSDSEISSGRPIKSEHINGIKRALEQGENAANRFKFFRGSPNLPDIEENLPLKAQTIANLRTKFDTAFCCGDGICQSATYSPTINGVTYSVNPPDRETIDNCPCDCGGDPTDCAASFICIDPISANSSLCGSETPSTNDDDDQGLTENVSRTLVDACTVGTKCEYICQNGYARQGNICVAQFTCINPTLGWQACPRGTLTQNTPYTKVLYCSETTTTTGGPAGPCKEFCSETFTGVSGVDPNI